MAFFVQSVMRPNTPYLSVLTLSEVSALPPYPLRQTMRTASQWECAMHLVKALHLEHGGKPHSSPHVPPFRTRVLQIGPWHAEHILKFTALAPSPAAVVRLSARCHSAAQNILCAVAAPLCSDTLPRPLRARHRRASPRVLALHKKYQEAREGAARQPTSPKPTFGRSPTADHMPAGATRAARPAFADDGRGCTVFYERSGKGADYPSVTAAAEEQGTNSPARKKRELIVCEAISSQ